MLYYTTVTVIKILKEILDKNRTVDRFINFFFLFIVFVFFLFILVLLSIQSISLSLFFFPLSYFLFFICLRQTYDELVKSDQTTVCMFTCIAINKTKTETLMQSRTMMHFHFMFFIQHIILFLCLFSIEMCRVCFLPF